MRYVIFFRDKTSIHVSESVGKQVIEAKMGQAKGVLLNGACISTDFITLIKPVKKGWFSHDFIEQQERIESTNPEAMKVLSAPSSDA